MLVCHNHYPYSLCLSYYYGQNFLKIAISQKEATKHIWAIFVRVGQLLRRLLYTHPVKYNHISRVETTTTIAKGFIVGLLLWFTEKLVKIMIRAMRSSPVQ